ncbi:MAG TPA: helical backbone metal receptor [Bryobacteraceae bacterium]|nr:helical backbone metal receptor [Bryobacteraceae bacterium]
MAAPPQRIISVSPNITEILYGVGAFSRVVAVSDFCTYPPEVKRLPRVGGWHNPSLERLASLRPDLVILTEAQAPFVDAQLRQLGVQTLIAPSRNIADIFRTITDIGQATGNREQAQALAARIQTRLDRIRQRVRSLPHPRALCIVSRTPGTLHDIYAATEGSYLAEVIQIAGGSVAAPSSTVGYGKVSQELLVTLNPDVILDLVHGQKTSLAENFLTVWNDLGGLKAVRTHRVYPVEDDYVVHASQMVIKTATLFARLLHPEVPAAEWEGR